MLAGDDQRRRSVLHAQVDSRVTVDEQPHHIKMTFERRGKKRRTPCCRWPPRVQCKSAPGRRGLIRTRCGRGLAERILVVDRGAAFDAPPRDICTVLAARLSEFQGKRRRMRRRVRLLTTLPPDPALRGPSGVTARRSSLVLVVLDPESSS